MYLMGMLLIFSRRQKSASLEKSLFQINCFGCHRHADSQTDKQTNQACIFVPEDGVVWKITKAYQFKGLGGGGGLPRTRQEKLKTVNHRLDRILYSGGG